MAASAVPAPTRPLDGRRERHVLIVEDEPPIRGMLADLLRDAGYAVLEAADGIEALKHLKATRPDLIVLDLMLPGMSGWQFLERSRKQLEQRNIPVVILSAIEGKGDYPTTLGVAAWLTKPIDVDKFIEAVDAMAGPARSPVRRGPGSDVQTAPRVLIVEDEAQICSLIVEHLAEEGFRPRAAESLAVAYQLIGLEQPNVIVLDLMMPGGSGFSFLRERQNDPRLSAIPVVVLSAAPPDRLLEAKELGAEAFLSKPFDMDALTALVRSFVH